LHQNFFTFQNNSSFVIQQTTIILQNLQDMFIYLLSIFLTSLHFGIDQSYNKVGYLQKGVASYYADDFHGKKTANGEKFDMNMLTAAHPRIRFNTMLRVTNTENGKMVTVRINDRGPYVGGRILDLSRAAAQKIDMVKNGTATITAEVISTETVPTIEEIAKRKQENKENVSSKEQTTNKTGKTKVGSLLDKIKNALLGKKTATQDQPKQDQPKDKTQDQPKKQDKKTSNKDEILEALPEIKPTKKPANTTNTSSEIYETDLPKPIIKPTKTDTKISTTNTTTITPSTEETKFLPSNTYNIGGIEKTPSGFGVQIGSYSDFFKMMETAKTLHQNNIATVYIQVVLIENKKNYRIIVGEGDENNARKVLIPALQAKGYKGFIKQHD
jgi:rare lipoprotein A